MTKTQCWLLIYHKFIKCPGIITGFYFEVKNLFSRFVPCELKKTIPLSIETI